MKIINEIKETLKDRSFKRIAAEIILPFIFYFISSEVLELNFYFSAFVLLFSYFTIPIIARYCLKIDLILEKIDLMEKRQKLNELKKHGKESEYQEYLRLKKEFEE